ncbi:flagellar basal body P-ring formation chaperone FlgA [Paraburkholderia unamae]|uniref:Flagella basal body P-ring formation protein FlgA n=1 Tax=Paraburkholderia unamae TaxID=219649 RepID=A0ABX5KUW8_9BURK|nr:flagellar basal body P-ring formation chaperone FlgA [Paraburkholderia unamae]PVX97389.1 flagella basal body P-ring formation protein FlgA [Paraburkholderia unamae]
MPQTASFRGPRAGLERRARALSWALPGVLPWAASCACALAFVLGGTAAHAQSAPQGAGGQVFIAGNGDRAGTDAAQMSAMLATNATNATNTKPASAAASAQAGTPAPLRAASYADLNAHGVPEDARAGVDSAGMITIPGPGERTSQADAPRIVTIPAPGTSAQPARVPPASVNSATNNAANSAANSAGALQRVNVASAANRVAPVVVDAASANGAPAAKPVASAGANTGTNASAVAMNTQATPPGQQDGESIRAAALAFLQQQSAGLPGRVTVTVSPVFPRGLAACTSLEPFMPPGARTFGRTTVGMRCIGAKPWTLYVGARVAVDITYYVAARQIGAGEALSAADFMPLSGDLASLPQTVVTDPNQASGAVARMRISAGLPLRTDMLRSAASVIIGQTVKVIAVGTNFTISAEGSALSNAEPGQQVRVRTSGGQVITGVVKDAGTVQIQI